MYNKAIIILVSFFLFFLIPSFNAFAEDNNKFRFAVMGCMHFGLCPCEDYELAVKKIKECNPDFVLFLGGMVDGGGEKPVESLWEQFDRITENLEVPVYDVLSDVNFSCGLRSLSIPKERASVMKKCFLDRYKKRFYSFEHKNNLFICLDSEKQQDFLDKEQLVFLKGIIANFSQYDNIFITIHRPLWFNNHNWNENVQPIIKDKVKYAFGANLHILNVMESEGCTYITTGCPPLSYPKYPVKPYFFHFLIVDVKDKDVSVKVVPVRPVPIEEMKSYGKKIDIENMFKFYEGQVLPSSLKADLLTIKEREAILRPAQIIQSLKIKPGMNILDIGAGAGFFTFRLAKALKGTGMVFATDVDPNMIEYLKEKMKEGKFENIFPILVAPDEPGLMHKQHFFDIIFLSEVYQYFWSPEEYFQKLRLLLKGGGRLYILHYKNVSKFCEYEFEDFNEAVKTLILRSDIHPVFKRLSKKVQYFIKHWQDGDEVPGEIRTKIVQDFNNMLPDRTLFNDLLAYYSASGIPEIEWGKTLRGILYPRDFRLATWLIVHIEEKGIFDNKEMTLTQMDKKRLCRLNRLLLTGIFQSDKLQNYQSDIVIYLEKNSIISDLTAAGFAFVREHDFLPQHYFLEFKREF